MFWGARNELGERERCRDKRECSVPGTRLSGLALSRSDKGRNSGYRWGLTDWTDTQSTHDTEAHTLTRQTVCVCVCVEWSTGRTHTVAAIAHSQMTVKTYRAEILFQCTFLIWFQCHDEREYTPTSKNFNRGVVSNRIQRLWSGADYCRMTLHMHINTRRQQTIPFIPSCTHTLAHHHTLARTCTHTA